MTTRARVLWIRKHKLGRTFTFFTAVELLLRILILSRVPDEEAMIDTTVIHCLDHGSYIPLPPAAPGIRRGRDPDRRRLVIPGDVILGPGST